VNPDPVITDPGIADLVITDLEYAVLGAPPFDVDTSVSIAITGGRITAIGHDEVKALPATRRIDGRGCVAVPGFTNGHTHGAFTLDRGLEPELVLDEWLPYVFDVSLKVDAEVAHASAMLAYTEMVKAGFTACVDHHYAQADRDNAIAVAEAAHHVGLRAAIGPTASDIGSGSVSLEDGVADLDRLVSWVNEHPGTPVAPWLALASPGRRETAQRCQDLRAWAAQRGVRTTYHFAETQAWHQLAHDLGAPSLSQLLVDMDLLGPDVVIAHGLWFAPEDWPTLAATGVHVSHNPVANGYLGDGIAPVAAMRSQGVHVCLGTDGPNCSGRADPFEMMRTAAMYARASSGDATVLSATDVLAMATSGGAEARGLHDAGRLAVGGLADVVLVDLNQVHIQPVHNVIWSLVWSATAHDVRTVVINGDVVVDDRRCQTADEEQILRNARTIAPRLRP